MKTHLFFLAAILALLLGCSKDSGVNQDPVTTTISSGVTGTLTFTGQWPANAAEVRMVTSKVFPPEMSDIIYGDTIPVNATTYDYQFALDPGIYRLIGVAWRNDGADWNIPGICSIYFSADDSLAPHPVTITNANSIVSGADMTVNCSKARIVSAAKITGTVTFDGVWPSEFTEARVIATTRFDLETFDLPTANDLTFSNSIAPGATTYNYEIPAFPGEFLATFVIFFTADGTISEENIFYSNDRGGLDIGTHYTAVLNTAVAGPNFTITFQ